MTMNLSLGKDNKVTGSYTTQMGEGEFTSGKFDPDSAKLTLVADNGRFELEYSGTVKGDAYAGDLDFNGGQFSMEFNAKRTTAAEPREEPAEAKAKAEKGSLADLVPGPRWVSSLEASRFKASRCYITLDGHRSNDDMPYLFVSEDYGKTWTSIKGNLPDTAGSVRVLREDIVNPNLLYLGCEFNAWFSVDRGQTWTKFEGLPTVAIHEFAIHPTAGEVVAGTHGRSLWVADVSLLRQLSSKSLSEPAQLMKPKDVINWSRGQQRGDHRRHEFQGENPSSNASLGYSLGRSARSVSLEIVNLKGEVVKSFEADNGRGFHVVSWDLRQESANRGGNARRGRGFRGGPRVPNGSYLVRLVVDGTKFEEVLTVKADPTLSSEEVAPDNQEDIESWLEAFDDEEADR